MARQHYKLISELGRGSSGVIHLALDVARNELVALKVLSEEALVKQPNALARFTREAKILTRLRHPNLVSVLNCGHAKGRPYYAMEYVDGRSLHDLLAQGPMSVFTALRITERLARALDYVHRRGIVHRDVKPSNILVDRELSTPRLADFGLARDTGEWDQRLTASGIAVGTMRYSSPEQCGGYSKDVDGRADLYSLGLVLCAALTGKQPRVPQTMEDLVGRFDREYGRQLRELAVPGDVIELCRKATRSDPRRRFRTARELAREAAVVLGECSRSAELALAAG